MRVFRQSMLLETTLIALLSSIFISSAGGMHPSVACTNGFDPKPAALNVTTLVPGEQGNFIYDVTEDPAKENLVFITGSMIKVASRFHRNTTALAGSSQAGDQDGIGTNAKFDLPNGGIAFTPDGTSVIVADTRNNKIKVITFSTGEVSTLAGSGAAGVQDGAGSLAQFATPSDVAVTPDGAFAIVADRLNHLIRSVSLSDGTTSTIAGLAGEEGGYREGPKSSALFNLPDGVAVTPDGRFVVVADSGNHRIRMVALADGETHLLAGSGDEGHLDGAFSAAMFNSPAGVHVTPNGLYVVVADRRNDRIRIVSVGDGTTSTLAGSASRGSMDGPATKARFNSPYGVHVAADGQSVLVADFGNNRARLLNIVDRSFENCSCNTGYGGDFDLEGCTICAEGTYKDFTGPGQCESCPLSANFSEPGSTSVLNCSCNPGFALNHSTSLTCLPCEAGTYKDSAGAAACTPCSDPNSHSLAGSAVAAACTCNAGYTGPDGGECGACASGTFKNESGSLACSACVANAVSVPASTSPEDCLCTAGYTGHGLCQECPVGTYKSDFGPNPCIACPPERSYSEAGSSAVGACTCDLGFEGDGVECAACPEGKYKDVVGAGACTGCPADTSSANASASLANCSCVPGLTRGAAGLCEACPAETFKDFVGDGECLPCPANSRSPGGSSAVGDCTCDAGYQRGRNGGCMACSRGAFKFVQGDSACAFCAQNTYKDTLGPGACEPCSEDGSRVSATGSISLDNCTCNAGFELVGGGCAACPAGKYKDFIGFESCSVCRDSNAISLNGSTDSAACQCVAGFEEEGVQSCRQCPPGSFKADVGRGPCAPCQEHATSPAGSLTADACACLPGFVARGPACVACPVDTFHVNGTANCSQCPPGTTAPAASGSQDDCVCRLGYTGVPGAFACSACPPGTYKDILGHGNCSLCPDANSESMRGAVSAGACVCSAGFSGSDGGPCSACPPGTYKNATGSARCDACNEDAWSGPASVSAALCLCNVGYSGPNGAQCLPCLAGTYKPSNGSEACTPCPPLRAHSPLASETAAACTCNYGFFGDGVSCAACPGGSYKDFPGPGNCSACPALENGTSFISSPVGSISIRNCSCVPGMAPGEGGVCVDCPQGTFKAAFGNQNCTSCPPNTDSPPGSAEEADCTCNPGYQPGRSQGCVSCSVGKAKLSQGNELCADCTPGTYKPLPGEGNCTACARDGSRTSPAGSVAFGNCTCNLGHDGDILGNCLACTSGTYKDFVGPSACAVCPDVNAVTERGSTHIENCTCPAGYTGEDAGSCTICSFGTFKEPRGNSPCEPCPLATPAAPAGSELAAACTCDQGLQLNATGWCTPCPAGQYKLALGAQSCAVCPVDTFKEAPGPGSCTPCSADGSLGSPQGSTSYLACACNVGYEGGTSGCEMCEPGTYKGSTGAQPCSTCPDANSDSLQGSTDLADCQCKPGFRRNATGGGPCGMCPEGTYKEQLGDAGCSLCPVNSSSEAGSTDIQDCACNAGFEVAAGAGHECSLCPPGTFKDGHGSTDCAPCPSASYKDFPGPGLCAPCANNSVSPLGSDRALDCQCDAGYIGPDGGPCAACPPGTFKTGLGDGVCEACPTNAISEAGSGSILDCVCARGFTGGNGSACSGCPAGTYKDATGSSECEACPEGSFSGLAAAGVHGCLCDPGYTGRSSGPCQPCEAGTYKNESGSQPCEPCGDNALSPVGSRVFSACECEAGYERLGSACLPCVEAFFKLVDGDDMCQPCRSGALKDWEGPGECSNRYFKCDGDAELGPNPVGDTIEGPSGLVDLYAMEALPSTNPQQVLYTEGNSINLLTIGAGDSLSSERLAGTPETFGYAEGVGESAVFDMPTGGLAVTPDGTSVVVADTRNNQIRIVDINTRATRSLAGSVVGGMQDGIGSEALFRGPADVAVTPDGQSVVVADRLNHRIRIVALPGASTAEGTTTTLAGSSTMSNGTDNVGGYAEGAGTEAQFNLPDAVAVSGDLIVVADTGNHRIRVVSLTTGATSLLAGSGEEGWRDGPSWYAMFYAPSDVSVTPSGLFAVVTDRRNDVVRLVAMLDGYTTTLVGSGTTGYRVGNATEAQFDNLYSSVLTPDGLKLVIGDTGNQRIRIVNMLDDSANCECNSGFTGTIADGCIPCIEGTYKDFAGDGTCTLCPVGRPVSRTGSHDRSGCTCDVGYTGEYPSDCIKCPSHTFKDEIGSEDCLPCPAFAGSAEGSISELNCTCNMGYIGADGDPCSPCPGGTYKNVTGQGVCLPCAANTVSPPGTAGLENCLCAVGYTGENGRSCQLCEVGTYKATNGSSPCTTCPSDRSHAPQGSISEAECTCNFGFEGDGAVCNACPSATYKDTTGAGTCEQCPDEFAYTDPGAGRLEDCACIAGYHVGDGQRCQECALGTYKDWDGFGDCAPCPAASYKDFSGPGLCTSCANNSISPLGSDRALDCQCDAGYIGPDGGPCAACPPGTFKTGLGDGVCEACPTNAISEAGSGSILDCVCARGFTGGNGSACSGCPAGTYKDATGPSECITCTTNSASEPGSASIAGCLCNPGYTGPDGGSCAACEAGTYKSEGGSHACTSCLSRFALTELASTSAADCRCSPGYERLDDLCSPCQRGFYKHAVGDEACDLCPPGTVKEFVGPGNCSFRYFTCPADSEIISAQGTTTAFEQSGGVQRLALTPDALGLVNVLENSLRIWVADTSDDLIEGNAALRQVAGGTGAGYVDDTLGSNARFSAPGGVAVSGGGSAIFVADTGNHVIRTVLFQNGSTTTLAGGGSAGFQDAIGTLAAFSGPSDVAVTADGAFVIVADRLNHRIRKVAVADGTTTTLAGSGAAGFADGLGSLAAFNLPEAVAVTPDGASVVVADSGNHRIRIVSLADGATRLLAGSGEGGTRDGPSLYARFNAPSDVLMMPSGLFAMVTDRLNNQIRVVALRDGETQTLVGSGAAGSQDGSASGAQFNGPVSAAATEDGLTLFIADSGNELIRTVDLQDISSTCQCNAGFSGEVATGCIPCAEGTYKEATGPGACEPCPDPLDGRYFSYTASPSFANCTCVAGNTLQDSTTCGPCDLGTYKEYPGSHTCADCPPFSSTPSAGSVSIGNCSCDAGYTSDDGACRACTPGTYKNTSGPAECTPCPLNSVSPDASVELLNCTCLPGYIGNDGEACEACSAGTFKLESGVGECTACAMGSYSSRAGAAACQPCPARRPYSPVGSDGDSDCSCFAGFEFDFSGACVKCPSGKFKIEPGPQPCSTCEDVVPGSTSIPGAISIQNCTCDRGYIGNDGEACSPCPAGTFKDYVGPGFCEPCPFLNTTSAPGSPSLESCACAPGNQGLGIGPCQACVPGKYKDFAGTEFCIFCPENSFSYEVGSNTADSCSCDAGYFGRDANCTACPVGSYKSTTGSEQCTACLPAVGYSPAASTDVRDCICDYGYQGLTDYDCRPCPPGFYKDTPGQGDCIACPDPNSNSSVASPSIESCMCDPGFTGPNGGTCIACESGTYKPMPGPQNCSECPDSNQNSSTASSRVTDCRCLPGYTGLDGVNCSACEEGKFKGVEGSSECLMCPERWRTYSPPASTVSSACECDRGYVPEYSVIAGVNGSGDQIIFGQRCFRCEAGTYKDLPGESLCKPCHSNSMSSRASDELSDCLCNVGYTAEGNSSCVLCAVGTYKNFTGPLACTSCPAGAVWSPEGSTLQSDCTCDVGFEETAPLQCRPCREGFFKNVEGPGPCTSCPNNSFAPRGSIFGENCTCDVGYTGLECLACPEGMYKDAPGQQACDECPVGFAYSPSGSFSVDNCTCAIGFEGNGSAPCTPCAPGLEKVSTGYGLCTPCSAGFFKLNTGPELCSPCAIGSYKPEPGIGNCTLCPEGTTFSPPGSDRIGNCTCDFGWAGNETRCYPCPAMTYKNFSGLGVCSPCMDNNSFSEPASALCECNTGYFGPDGRECLACPPGTFKLPGVAGSDECELCASGTYRNETGPGNCTMCPDAFSSSLPGSPQVEDCVCNKGYSGPDGGPCAPCSVGTHKNFTGSGSCVLCPDWKEYSPPASTSILACTCPPGFSLVNPNTTNCTECPAGFFKDASGYGNCTQCPDANSFSAAASTHLANCTCNAGYAGPDGGNCTACPESTHKLSRGDSECTPCTNNSYAPAGSDSILWCMCVEGYSGDTVSGGLCSPCAVTTYKDTISHDECYQCPPEADYSLTGSTSLDNCTCNVGFFQNDSFVCGLCEPGKYKDTLGTFNCTMCPDPNSYSDPGSTVVSNCSCNFGYVGLDGGNCTICPVGTYKVGSNPGVCTPCPTGTYQDTPGAEQVLLTNISVPNGTNITGPFYATCKVCPDPSHTSAVGSENLTDCVCQPGYSGVPGINCSACPANTYKTPLGNQPCLPCPHEFSVSSPATTSIYNCSCAAGYTGPNGGNCTACPLRTYKFLEGDSECVACTNFSFSLRNSTNIDECKCIEGYSGETRFGDPCLPCPESTYKDFIGHGTCLLCPTSADFSLEGSTHLDNCTCNLGYTHNAAGDCAPCETGTYKDVYGFSNCTACPHPFSSSPLGSPAENFCACNAGYVGPNGGVCTICPIGTFKDGIDPGVCAPCPIGTYQATPGASECASCPDPFQTTLAEGSFAVSACVCNAGYTGPPGGNCSVCPSGTYKNQTGPQECTPCVAAYGYSDPGSISVRNCTCAPGFGEIGNEGCEPCSPGTYKDTTGRGNCTRCPYPHTTSAPASPSVEFCVCNAGFTGPDGGECSPCAVGTFKPLEGSQACTDCSPFSMSPLGSTTAGGCLCDVGYTGNGNCTACPRGTYKNVTGSSPCVDCPLENRQYSDPGAVNVSECLCERGYTKNPDPSLEECVACTPGTYKFFEGMQACMDCPSNSMSPERSYFPWDCKCDLGYTGRLRDGDDNEFIATLRICEACEPGTYKNFTGPLHCVDCPVSAVYSPEGSATVSACSCDIGFEEVAPLRCAACGSGTFKPDVGPGPCALCPANSFSPLGSFSPFNCTCDVGYEGLQCSACLEGTYKNQTGTGNCVACPAEFNYSSPASVELSDCTCGVGLTGDGSSACVPCPAGTFKHVPGFLSCTTCPDANSHGPLRSTSAADCVCNAGFTGPDGGSCTPCPPGSFKNETGAGLCAPCPAGTYKDFSGPGDCVACPLGNGLSAEGSTSVTACNCSTGYEGTIGGSCVPCSAGTQKLSLGFGGCTDCPPGTFKLAASGEKCTPCEPGTYKPWAGPGLCTLCFNGTGYSEAGSTAEANCTCGRGHGGSDAASCYACPPGSYKDFLGPGECTPCMDNNSFSLAASPSADACQCNAGFSAANGSGVCAACPAGSFKDYLGTGACQPCAAGSYKNASGPGLCTACPVSFEFSPEGSAGIEDCTCTRGFAGDRGFCEPCTAGSYKDRIGRDACTPCPDANSLSFNASTHIQNCTCNAGYEGLVGDSCNLCQEGTFKDYWGAGLCMECPDGTLPGNAQWLNEPGQATSAPPGSPCGWECMPGFYHQDPLGEEDDSQPNTCKQCSGIPSENPCGPGEYWATECNTEGEPGCRECTNLVGGGSYMWPNPAWTSADCPYTCPEGSYASRAVQNPIFWYPDCVECPPAGSTCQGPCGLGAAYNDNTDCSL